MGKHRTRLKIVARVLSVVNDNNCVKKTKIMYDAYLSYKLLVQYLVEVTEAGLLECKNGNSYTITDKGKTFLSKFAHYSESYDLIKKQLKYIDSQKNELEKMCTCNG